MQRLVAVGHFVFNSHKAIYRLAYSIVMYRNILNGKSLYCDM